MPTVLLQTGPPMTISGRDARTPDEPGETAQLARFVANATWGALSDDVRHEAKRSVLNHLAAGFAGCRDPAIQSLLRILVPLSGPRTAGLIGRTERVDMLSAAFLNAAAANVLDFDDTHLRTVIHPAAPIAPPLLALSQSRPISGADFLLTFVLGVEVCCRLGNAVSPWHYGRGWHITSTCGAVGAAAACGRTIGLDEDRIAAAIGGGVAQASGLVETLGFGAKSLSVGNAARNGLFAALAADAGLTGPPEPIEGARGFVRVMGQNAKLAELTDGLGETWQIALNTYKSYPCGIVLHPVIDACLELREAHEIAPDIIRRVVVRAHPLLRQRTDRPQVETGREAQVSLRHTVGVVLVRGKAGVAEYSDEAVHDPDVRAIGARVEIVDDDTMPTDSCFVRIGTRDGRMLGAHVQHARGSLGRPLGDRDIEAKLVEQAAANAPSVDVRALIDAVWSLDEADDAAVVARLAATRDG